MIKDIVLICDDNYTLPTAVCISSIVRNSGIDVGVSIHVCSFSLTEENQKLLKDCGSELFKIQIHILDFSKYQPLVSRIKAKTHVSKAALIKFELPNIFTSLDGILYIDSDIIIKSNLADLLETDLSNNYIAASYEFWREIEMDKYEFFKNNQNFYFNSGVMLLNLDKMREDCITDKLWNFKINRAITRLMDQESFNAICSEYAIKLSIKWNFNPIFKNNNYIKQINKRYSEHYLNCEDMFDDVRIIHYVGKSDKPWVYKDARNRKYWDDCFDSQKFGLLNLKKYISEKSFLDIFIGIYKQYGLLGYVSLAIYNLSRIFRRK